jgi:hypothetical protein
MRCEKMIINQKIYTPLGVRPRLSTTKEYPYIISEDLCEFKEIPMVVKNTPKWTDTKVVDWSRVNNCTMMTGDDIKGNEIQYICVIFYRYVLGVFDSSNRNMLINRDKNKIYSVDEDEIGCEFKFNCTKVIKDEIKKIYTKNKKEIKKILESWTKQVKENGDKIKEKLSVVVEEYEKFYDGIVENIENLKDVKFVEKLFSY